MPRNPKDVHENGSGSGGQRRLHTFMSTEDVNSGKKSVWQELQISGQIRNISPNMWKLVHLKCLYLNDNLLSRIPADIAKLEHLCKLDLSGNKLRNLPAEMGDLVGLKELFLKDNLLRLLPYELGKLFRLNVLTLEGNPLTKEVLTLHAENDGTRKLITYLLDNLQVTAPVPPQRPWVPLARPNVTRPTCVFTVMCYNVLCDKYATRNMYGYCPSWALEWEYRKKGIMEEIRHYTADIICLQEVETSQFYQCFLPELVKDGYAGIFAPKSRAKTMAENDRKSVDGCAIFYRTAKFEIITEHLIEFNQLAMLHSEGSDNMLNRVMPKDNIALAALLKMKPFAWSNGIPPDANQVDQLLLVCTAHMHWDPEYCDVKLVQTSMLTNELQSFLENSSHNFRPGHKPETSAIQVLLCGDFNSLPDSGVYEFLTSGRVPADHKDFKSLIYQPATKTIPTGKKINDFTHSFKLASAYSKESMPYTNYTHQFKGVIDYIFYSKQSMTPLGLLGPLSAEWFSENKVVGCPHPLIPSDHFPLLVELELEMLCSSPTISNNFNARR